MRDNFYKTYSRKDDVKDDQFHFSYNMFKTHFEKVDIEKNKYTEYEDKERNYFEITDLKGDYKWVGVVAATCALAYATFYYVNA